MDSSFAEWLYLQQIVGNFDGLVEYYFGSVAFFGPWFRQAGVGILYSMGLAWAGFCFVKAPVDRLQHGLAVLGMVILCGFLLSPTTNTKNLGIRSGTELSWGGYYSYYMAGTMTSIFSDVLKAAWKNSIVEAAGGEGPNKEAIALAFNDQSQKFAEKWIQGEGKDAYIDYYQKCGNQALSAAKTPEEKAFLTSVGVGAATLGMTAAEADSMTQAMERVKTSGMDFSAWMTMVAASEGGMATSWAEAKMWESKQAKAREFLKNNLPDANNNIDGSKGYRLPETAYYKTLLAGQEAAQTSSTPMFKSVSGSGGTLSTMLPKGATTTTPSGEDDYTFYPKNCAELFEVANATMASFRSGVKGVPGYENLPQAGSAVSLSAANLVDQGVRDAMGDAAKQAGVDLKFDPELYKQAINNYTAAQDSMGNWFNKFMLNYKIPFTIAAMAMIVNILLVTFPVFACIAVIFGHKTLVTYFKLMAFPFIVVFTNNLLLILSANVISYNKVMKLAPETFMPGSVDLAGAIASMNTETVVYSVICVAEIAIARLILWDDVKAVTSMNLGAAATSATQTGMGLTSKALSMVAGAFAPFRMASKAAIASKAAEGAKQTNNHIAQISQAVSNIASKGGQFSQNMGGGSTNRGSNKNQNQPGGNPNGPGGPSLNPPPKNP